jgi:hypothetical protein
METRFRKPFHTSQRILLANALQYRTTVNPPALTGLAKPMVRSMAVEYKHFRCLSLFRAESGLLRVQSASIFSAPEITRTSLRRAQSLFGFPLHPVTGIKV